MEFERTILVADDEKYDGKNWREALTRYVTGVLTDDFPVTNLSRIWVDDYENGVVVAETVIFLYHGDKFYIAEGRSLDNPPPTEAHPLNEPRPFPPEDEKVLTVTDSRADFEWGLAKFVYNDKIKYLRVNLGKCRWLYLWKRENGLLGVKIDIHD